MTLPTTDKTNRGRRRSRFVRSGFPDLLRIAAIVAIAITSGACISIDLLGGGDAPLEESIVAGERGPKVLLLEVDGVISGAEVTPGFFGIGSTSMVARVREALDRARQDSEVKAVLLRIDSPGGTATASEQVYTEIMRFKRERGTPVVAQLLTTAASGGYYIAMAADSVQAHPTTVVGSIGVIFSSMNFAGLMEKLGVEDQTITGGEFKDIGSPFRPLTGEERAQLQSIVDDLHARFREIVEIGRPKLSSEQVSALANGRIYSAPQALGNGLVDSIGTMHDAVGALARELGAPKVRVVAYHRPNAGRRNLYMRNTLPAPRLAAPRADALFAGDLAPWAAVGLRELLARPGFHYLWWPGLSGGID